MTCFWILYTHVAYSLPQHVLHGESHHIMIHKDLSPVKCEESTHILGAFRGKSLVSDHL